MIYFQELLILTGICEVSRFVYENERVSGDVNTVLSTHVECVVLLTKVHN